MELRGFLDSSVGKESAYNAEYESWPGKDCWRWDRINTLGFLDFPCGSAGNKSTCSSGYPGLTLGLGRPQGDGKGYPLQYSDLENSMESIIYMRLEQKPNEPKCEC